MIHPDLVPVIVVAGVACITTGLYFMFGWPTFLVLVGVGLILWVVVNG